MADGNIAFNASLKTAGFDSGAKHLQNVAASTAGAVKDQFGKIATAVIGIGAAFVGINAAVQSFRAAIDMGGKLNDLSARTGESAGNLAILQRAFENAGAGADAVGPTINRLQRAIVEAGEGGKQQAEAFAKLGLNLSEIRNLTPTEQLQAVAKALQGVGNDSERGAVAMQLLGRSGGELLPLLRAMGVELDTARAQLGSLPGVIDRTNAALDTIGDNFGAIAAKGKEFAAGLLERLAPALANITTKIAEIDAAGFGRMISGYIEVAAKWIAETFKLANALDNVKLAIDGITSGEFGKGMELLFVTARLAASNAINEITAMAMAALQTIGGAMSQMFSSNGALMLLLNTSFSIAANYFKEALYNALADFMAAIGRSGMAETFRYQAETAANQIKTLTYSIGSVLEEVGEQSKEVFKGIPQAYSEAYNNYAKSPLIETRDLLERQKQLSAELAANIKSAGINAGDFAKAMRGNPLYAGIGVQGMLNAPAGSPRPEFQQPGIFGMNPEDLPPIPDSPSDAGGGGGGGSSGSAPKTAWEMLNSFAKDFDKNAMTRIGRIGDRANFWDQKSQDYASRGMHRVAAEAAVRAEKIRQKEASKALEGMGKDAAKPEAQRKKEAEDAAGAAGGRDTQGKTLDDLWKELKELNTKLPQNSLS